MVTAMIVIELREEDHFDVELVSDELIELKKLAMKYEFSLEQTLFYVIEYGINKLSDNPYR